MNARNLLLAGLVASILIPVGSVATAAPGAAPAAPAAPIRQGPPIPGYCVFSMNDVLGGSKVGQAVSARLSALTAQVKAELQPEADGIRSDERVLESTQASTDAATLQAKRANIELRVANLEKREQLRQQEMQATQQKQIGVILRELDPIMKDLYQQKGCSVLIDGDQGGIRLVNPAMNLSPQAVAGLDARIQTLTFDREHLDTQPGAGAAAAR